MKLSSAQAIAAGQTLLGADVLAARPLSSFAGNQVFELRLPDRLAYLKLARNAEADRSVRREIAVLERVRERGVPVPAVDAYDETGAVVGVPCAVLAAVGGEPLTGVEPVFREIGAHLRSVHEVPVSGFGAISPGAELVGGDKSWMAALERPVAALLPAADAGLVPHDLLRRAKRAIERFADVLASVDARLVHGDFHPRHVFADDTRITGIIDWGDAMAGDPAYDFGRLLHSGLRAGGMARGRSLVVAALSTYGESPWHTGADDRKIVFYAAMFAVSSMEGEFASGAPWPPFWPVNVEVLAMLLDALDTP